MQIPVTSAGAMFDQAWFGVAQASRAGDWQFLNDRFCEIVGLSRQELLASSDRDIAHPDDRAATDEVVCRLLASEISSSSLENRYVPEGWNHHVGQAACLTSKGSRLTGRTVPSC